MKESGLTRRITDRLWKLPASYVVKIHGGPYGRKGIPDVLWVYDGHAVFIEVKAGKNKQTKLQAFESERILKAHATCRVVRSMLQLEALVREIVGLEAYNEMVTEFRSSADVRRLPDGLQ